MAGAFICDAGIGARFEPGKIGIGLFLQIISRQSGPGECQGQEDCRDRRFH